MMPASSTTGGTVKLYRAVSLAELADIRISGGFHPGPPSFQGKWFAETGADAVEWGSRLYGAATFHVMEVEMPLDIADQLFRVPTLDKIGAARFAEIDQLPLINAANLGISELPVPGRP